MTVFKLGINNCFAVKRWPMPADWAGICHDELGVDLVQFSFDLLDPRTLEPGLSEMIDLTLDTIHEKSLTIHSTFTGLAAYSFNLLTHPNSMMQKDALDWYSNAIKVTKKLGSKVTGGHVAAISYPDYTNTQRRKHIEEVLVNNLHFLSFLAANEGLEMLLWEPMPLLREPPCAISDSKRLLEKVNERSKIPIKLAIDTGHQCTVGVKGRDNDVYAWLRELAHESPVIHIQQTDGKGDRHWPFTHEYNKAGIIKPEKVIRAIDGSRAREVNLMLEVIHPFEAEEKKIIKDLKESLNYWKIYL